MADRKGSTLARFVSRSNEGRAESFVYEGIEFKFSESCSGDDYFAVLYPDPLIAQNEVSAYARANGRAMPYPIEIYGDVLAIEKAYVVPEGEDKPDRAVIFALYDSDPGLFGNLRAHALQAIGVVGASRNNSGMYAWQTVYLSVRELMFEIKNENRPDRVRELASSIYAAAYQALTDYRTPESLKEILELPDSDKDPILEQLGNLSGATESSPG